MWKFPSFLVNTIKIGCLFHGFLIFQGCTETEIPTASAWCWGCCCCWCLELIGILGVAEIQPPKFSCLSTCNIGVSPGLKKHLHLQRMLMPGLESRMLWWCFEILFGGRLLLYQHWKNTFLWNLANALKLRHLNQHQVISWMQDLVIDISFDIQTISIYIYIYAYMYMVQINSAQKSLPPITTPNGSHPGSLLSTARPFVIGERYSCRVKSWWKCSNVSRCIIVHSNAFGSSSTDVEPECVCSLGMSDDSDSSRCFLVFLKGSQQWHSRNQPWDQLKAVSVDRNQNYRHHWLRDPPLSHLHVHVSYVVLYFCCSFSAPQFLHAQLQRWVFGCVRWIRCHYWCSIEVLLR